MKNPDYIEFLSQEEIERINNCTFEVLEETGVEIIDEDALGLMGDMGCRVDLKSRRVRFPADLLERLIRRAPSQFTWHGRNPEHNIVFGDGTIHFGTGSSQTTIAESNGFRRPATYKDAERIASLIDVLEHTEEGSGVVLPQDVPIETAGLWSLLATVKKSAKPFRALGETPMQVKASIRIAEILAGGSNRLRDNKLLLGGANVASPLTHHQADALLEFAAADVPIYVSPQVQSGATGPVTLAGTIVQHNAEVLSGIAIVEAANPGNPVMYGQVSSIMDMKVGTFCYAAIEHGILNAVMAQMARFYGIPSRGDAALADSKALDMQAGYESALTILMAALGGQNYIWGAITGILDSGSTVSVEKLLIDNEIVGNVKRVLRGIEVSHETLAIDLIKSIGPGNNFLGLRHTMDYLESEHFIPKLTDREHFSSWKAKGMKKIQERAKERIGTLLSEYMPIDPLDERTGKEIEDFLKGLDAEVAKK